MYHSLTQLVKPTQFVQQRDSTVDHCPPHQSTLQLCYNNQYARNRSSAFYSSKQHN